MLAGCADMAKCCSICVLNWSAPASAGVPQETLPKGIQVRVKNKGSRAHKRGRKRSKYQAPCQEHPQTSSAIENAQIHANHLESFNASLCRRCAAYRRKTNTYAKKKKRLKPSLDVYWILHNFVRVHFTTQHVPAVALGIIEQGLPWQISSPSHAFGIKRNQCHQLQPENIQRFVREIVSR